MKNLFSVFAVICVIALCASCSKKDDGIAINTNNIVGKWELKTESFWDINEETDTYGDYKTEENKEGVVLEINESGSYKTSCRMDPYNTDSGNYTLDNNILKFSPSSWFGYEIKVKKVEKNSLTLCTIEKKGEEKETITYYLERIQ